MIKVADKIAPQMLKILKNAARANSPAPTQEAMKAMLDTSRDNIRAALLKLQRTGALVKHGRGHDTRYEIASNGRVTKRVGDYRRMSRVGPASARYKKPKGPAKKQERSCMCCGVEFPSDGSHNRLCGPCRRSAGSMPAQFA